ncbi:MAG: hypothetical protein ACI814_004626, partial [Mariniblastus sp.]
CHASSLRMGIGNYIREDNNNDFNVRIANLVG